MLRDGRTVAVRTTVKMGYGGGDLSNALTARPVGYAIETINPDTRAALRWIVPRGFSPLMLDFAEGIPYLVARTTSLYSNLKQFGCPEIPFVFFRFDVRTSQWVQLASRDFPRDMLKRNVLIDINDNRKLRGESIPTTFAEWTDKYKNGWRVEHAYDGCKASVPSNEDPSHPQWAGKPTQPAEVDFGDRTIFDPPLRIPFADLGTGDVGRDAHCRSFLRLVPNDNDAPEMRGWYLFVNDPTGRKKAKPGGLLACDERALWFIDTQSEFSASRKRVVLTKFTIGGDFVYRISFARPADPYDRGGVVLTSFQSRRGVVEFEWWERDSRDYILTVWSKRTARIVEPAADTTVPR